MNSNLNSVYIKRNEWNNGQNENESFEFSKIVDNVMVKRKILSKFCSSLTCGVFDKITYPKFIIVNPQWMRDKTKVLENTKVIDLKKFALALEQEVGEEVEPINKKLKEEIVKAKTKNMLLKDYILQVRKEFVPIVQYEKLKKLNDETIGKTITEKDKEPVDEKMITSDINSQESQINDEPLNAVIKTIDGEFTSNTISTYKYLKESTDKRGCYEISPDLVPIRICTRCSWFELVQNYDCYRHLKHLHNVSTKRGYRLYQFKTALMTKEKYCKLYCRKAKTISISEVEANCYNLPEGHLIAEICLLCQWISTAFKVKQHFQLSHKSFDLKEALASYHKTVVMKKTQFELFRTQYNHRKKIIIYQYK